MEEKEKETPTAAAGEQWLLRYAAIREGVVERLRRCGRYDSLLDCQIDLAATALVRVEQLRELAIVSPPVTIEYSREGKERRRESECDRMLRSYLERAQLALRALGMNMDAKERKGGDDGFGNVLAELKAGFEDVDG